MTESRKQTTDKSRKSRATLLASIGAGLVVVVATVAVLTLTREPAPDAVSPATAAPALAPIQPNSSDSFDWWQEGTSSDDVQLRSSTDAHGGRYSLSVHSTVPQAASVASQLEQSYKMTPGSTYTISFWAKSENAGDGAVEIRPGRDWDPVVAIPGGTYDWTQFSMEYTMPSGSRTSKLRVVVHGPTENTLIDSLSVVGVEALPQDIMNGDFETHSGDVAILNSTLMFTEGEGRLDLSTRRTANGNVSWTIENLTNGETTDGNTEVTGHSALVDVSTLPRGYYKVDLSVALGAETFDRSTTFAVLGRSAATPVPSNSRFGTHLHFKGGDARVANLIENLAFTGIGHVRTDVSWEATELEKGVYTYQPHTVSAMDDFARLGMTALQLPVYSNKFYDGGRTPSSAEGLQAYANFANDTISKFDGVGQDVEVYNEFDHTFNTGACGPTPACYLDMLSTTARTIKAANPNAVVVAPGNAGMGIKIDWLREFVALGGLQYTDAISAHPYIRTELPETLGGQLDELNEMVKAANGGVSKPIWLTEMGWSTVPNWVDDTAQANFLVRMMSVALGHGVERVYWYEAADSGLISDDGESNFGLFEAAVSLLPNTNAPKQSAVAQAVLAQSIADKPFSTSTDLAAGAHSYAFGKGEAATRVLWSEGESATVVVQASGPVQVTDMFGSTTSVTPTKGEIELQLSPRALYLDGPVTGITTR